MPPHQDLCLNSKQTRPPVIVSTEYMYPSYTSQYSFPEVSACVAKTNLVRQTTTFAEYD